MCFVTIKVMKNNRWMFVAFAVVPGALAALFCAIAFAQDISLYLSMQSPSIQSLMNNLSGKTPYPDELTARAMQVAQVAGKTLLRFNCFLSGAGLLLSLILLTLGLQGLRSQRETPV